MNKLYWLYPDKLAGRPGPTEAPWDLAVLASAGIGHLISLEAELAHPADATAAGIVTYSFAIPDDSPARDTTEEICRQKIPEIVTTIRRLINGGQTVLVHCIAGNDRTGLALASYLAVNEDLTPQQAVDRIRCIRPTSLSTPGWDTMACRVIAHLQTICKQ